MTLTHATWNCAKAMLSLTLPFQVIIRPTPQRNTHPFCNQQAVNILKRDGLRREALLFHSFLDILNQGSAWCDRGFKYISHYYNCRENTGLWHGPDAPTECQFYFNKALKKWRQGQRENAIFYLGAASHIMQDLCVPHHAGGLVLSGHQFFEDWAGEHYHNFAVGSGGIYHLSENASGWVKENAIVSVGYLPEVTEEKNVVAVEKAVADLLQRAQRTTAGFLYFFLQSVKD